ncbi:MAG: tRNA threonylcarbamoyladenosine dehydratase [Peptococcaceae bacterium]|nr:tRNA threonylcarbamoyladenosine dehydratase [Peptococcaceae bacterium]
MDWQERSRRLIGDKGAACLGQAHVMLFGLGGVGSFVAEALVRSGVGTLSLVEYDHVTDSNRNRQIPALLSTVGRPKIEVMHTRLLDINPLIKTILYPIRMTSDNLGDILDKTDSIPDFIADAIDDIAAKVSLILAAREKEIPLISSMGAGYRLDPSKLEIGDISGTHTCPMARKLRRSLREAGVSEGVPVVWSKETPIETYGEAAQECTSDNRRTNPASMVFVPAAAGLLMASYIVRALIAK